MNDEDGEYNEEVAMRRTSNLPKSGLFKLPREGPPGFKMSLDFKDEGLEAEECALTARDI